MQNFLNTSSVAANVLTYACVLAKKHDKELKLADFCIAIDSKLESYYSGFLASMDAIQLIDSTEHSNTKRIYDIGMVHPHLIENTKTYVDGFLERSFKDTKPQIYERWNAAMNNVEKLFQ